MLPATYFCPNGIRFENSDKKWLKNKITTQFNACKANTSLVKSIDKTYNINFSALQVKKVISRIWKWMKACQILIIQKSVLL